MLDRDIFVPHLFSFILGGVQRLLAGAGDVKPLRARTAYARQLVYCVLKLPYCRVRRNADLFYQLRNKSALLTHQRQKNVLRLKPAVAALGRVRLCRAQRFNAFLCIFLKIHIYQLLFDDLSA